MFEQSRKKQQHQKSEAGKKVGTYAVPVGNCAAV
jgi:hypothetical protein